MIEPGIWYVHLFLRLLGHSCFQAPLNIQGIPNLVKLWQQTQMFPGEKKRHLLEVPILFQHKCACPHHAICFHLRLSTIPPESGPPGSVIRSHSSPSAPWRIEKHRNLGGFVTGIAHLFAAGRDRTWKYVLIVFFGLIIQIGLLMFRFGASNQSPPQ